MVRAAQPADVFTAIAEPRRRELIVLLSDGQPHAVNDLVLRLELAQPAVSKHLATLRQAGVVTVAKHGKHRLYRLNAQSLKPIHDWAAAFERHWTRQVDTIKQRAERKALQRLIRLDDEADKRKDL